MAAQIHVIVCGILLGALLLHVGGVEVKVREDLYIGRRSGAVEEFLGIPYASPPTGDRRWRPPTLTTDLPSELDHQLTATKMAPACLQVPRPGFGFITDSSEDCLYLNIWRSANVSQSSELVPVMVWIYGGGFIAGSTDQPLYDGRNFTTLHNVILVSVGYRLGSLGALALPQLKLESGTTGNYGLQDQRAALQWVQSNIKSFGGDPDRVTIFGESAGATSVGAHIALPKSKGLFSRAIMESGIVSLDTVNPPLEQGYATGEELAKVLGCDTASDRLDCMRAVPGMDVITAFGDDVIWYPFADDSEWPAPLATLYATGAIDTTIPVIAGYTLDESGISLGSYVNMTETEWNRWTRLLVPSQFTDQLRALYPVGSGSAYETYYESFRAMISDSSSICPVLDGTNEMVRSGASVRVYSFSHAPPQNPPGCGACHGSELAFLFANPYWVWRYGAPFQPEQETLIREIMGLWALFASGDITTAIWPVQSATSSPTLVLDLPQSVIVPDFRTAECTFWQQMQAKVRSNGDTWPPHKHVAGDAVYHNVTS